jgi:hypothetical protein
MTAQLSDATSPAVAGSLSFSGTVTWTLPSGTTTCTVAGSDECSVTYTPASGDVGDKTISAQYTGDPNYDDSTTINHSLNVTPRSVLIDIVCQPATVYVNQITNITVTVTDVGCGASVTPTGTIVLSLVAQGSQAGTFVQPTGSSAGTGAIEFTGGTYTPTANDSADDESHTLTATFTGTGDFNGISATGTFPLDVNKREVRVTVEFFEPDPSWPTTTGGTALGSAAVFIGQAVGVRAIVDDVTPTGSPWWLEQTSPLPSPSVSFDDLGRAGTFASPVRTDISTTGHLEYETVYTPSRLVRRRRV